MGGTYFPTYRCTIPPALSMGVKSPQVGDMNCLCPWEHPHPGTLPYTHSFLSSTPKSVCVFSFQGKYGIVDINFWDLGFFIEELTSKWGFLVMNGFMWMKTDTVIHKDWGAADLAYSMETLHLCFGHILTGKHAGYSQAGSNGYQCFYFYFFYWKFCQILHPKKQT